MEIPNFKHTRTSK